MIVVDASIVAKWLLPEEGSEEALLYQDGPHQLVAPDIIRLEVAGAITRRARDNKEPLPPKEAIKQCQDWFQLLGQSIISLIPERDILAPAVDLSVQIRHPLPDCLYLAVAISFDAELVTADDTFHKRAHRHYKRVLPLLGRS